jgi:hypothetical protein
VTWGFEKAKDLRLKDKFPLTSHHRADSPANQPIKRSITKKRDVPARDKATRDIYMQAYSLG